MAHNRAKEKSKQAFGACVFRNTKPVDGAHFYSAGMYPALADIHYNIFPMTRHLHSTPDAACFDWALNKDSVFVVRSIAERHWILLNLTLIDFRPLIRSRLEFLEQICAIHGIDWQEPTQPEDLHELLHGFKNRRGREAAVESNGAGQVGTVQADL